MTDDELARLVCRPGWAWPYAAVTAMAVALAESGGDPHAVHVVDRPDSPAHLSLDLGLWQINTWWHAEVPIAEALDPETAVAHAQRISTNGRSWSPWAAWKSGAYRRHLPRAQAACRAVGWPV